MRSELTLRDMDASQSLTLGEFLSELKKRMPNPNWRPLVCDGSPLECDVFVVGYNPATTFITPFSDHWDKDHGFMRERFLQDFRRQRNQLGKLRGTRARLELITEQFKCKFGRNAVLETNIFLEPTAKANQLEVGDTKMLEFLMEKIKPKIVFVHGSKAFNEFGSLCIGSVERTESLQKITWEDRQIRFLWSRHLSLVSNEQAKNIGKTLAEELQRMA